MVLPTAITLHNYRSFAGPQNLEIRPVTLLYGENNAGKSALLRALTLLADSALDGLDALEFERRLASLELDFDSLRWKGRAETDEHTVGIELHWSDDPKLARARFAVWEEPKWHRLLVQQLTLATSNGTEVGFEWILRREDRRASVLPYRQITAVQDSEQVMLEFHGLVPKLVTGGETGTADLIATLAQRLDFLASRVIWLRSLRPAPERTIRWTGSVRRELEPRGTDAPILLADDASLLAEVAAWYREHLRLDLKIQELRKREMRVVLRKLTEATFDIDLIDTGEGLGQVLPVLTALAMADLRAPDDGPMIVAVEEPEAHLHPTLQQALAQRVCAVAGRSGTRVLLETHSKQFLLAVQRAILQGAIAEHDVILYWVRQLANGRSVADPITLTELARLRGAWPADAFEAELDLEAEIQDLRDAKDHA